MTYAVCVVLAFFRWYLYCSLLLGCPYPGEEGVKDAEDHPEESFFAGYIRRAQERHQVFRDKLANPIWDKLLPDPLPAPYQQPYTLVINLDNTLIHSTWDKDHGWRVAKRPGAEYFLAYLFQHYEIVIFTTQTVDVRCIFFCSFARSTTEEEMDEKGGGALLCVGFVVTVYCSPIIVFLVLLFLFL